MTHYQVIYTYKPGSSDLRTEIREKHVEWLNSFVKTDQLVLGGKYTADDGALLVWKYEDTPEKLRELLKDDPYNIAGAITDTTIAEFGIGVGTILNG